MKLRTPDHQLYSSRCSLTSLTILSRLTGRKTWIPKAIECINIQTLDLEISLGAYLDHDRVEVRCNNGCKKSRRRNEDGRKIDALHRDARYARA